MRAIPESWLKIGYNLLFTVGFALTWPYLTYLIWRRQPFWERLGERLGHYPQELKEWLKHPQRPVWIHAVCGGDVVSEGFGSGDEGFKTRPKNFNYDRDTHGAKSG